MFFVDIRSVLWLVEIFSYSYVIFRFIEWVFFPNAIPQERQEEQEEEEEENDPPAPAQPRRRVWFTNIQTGDLIMTYNHYGGDIPAAVAREIANRWGVPAQKIKRWVYNR